MTRRTRVTLAALAALAAASALTLFALRIDPQPARCPEGLVALGPRCCGEVPVRAWTPCAWSTSDRGKVKVRTPPWARACAWASPTWAISGSV